MTHAEFHAALSKIAGDLHYATAVEAMSNSAGSAGTTVEWKGYIDGCGWHFASTPEAVLEAFRSPPLPLESIDPPPAPVEAVGSEF